jgi:hypothetical protein
VLVDVTSKHYPQIALAVLVVLMLVAAVFPAQTYAYYHEYAVINLSDNIGISIEPRIALPYYDNPRVVWSDSSFGQTEILFKASSDGGKSFGKTVNLSNSSGSSSNAEIASWDSRIYVVWDDETSGNDEVMFTSSSDSGATFTPPINLSNSSADSVEAKVAMPEASEDVYVVWTERNVSTGDDYIIFRASNDSGSTFGEAINLSDDNSVISSSNPQLVVSYVGKHVYITWQTILDDGNSEVFLRHSGNGGMTFDKPVNLSNSRDYYSDDQTMAISGDYLFAVWLERNSTVSDVLFRRISVEGTTLDDAINLSSDVRSANFVAARPQISANFGGYVFVLWYESISSGDNRIVLGSSLDSGYSFESEIVLANNVDNPDSANLAVGDYYVSVIWQRDNDIYFRQQSPNNLRVFTKEINLSNNHGDSYSPQIAADGPMVVAVWTNSLSGNSTEISFMDITPLVYFEYPLYYGIEASIDSVSQIRNAVAGDNVTITGVIDNSKELMSVDAMFGLQILDDKGIAEFVSISNVTFLPQDVNKLVSFTWTPDQSGWKTIQSFLWSNDGYPLAEKIEDHRMVVGSGKDYNLSLEHELGKRRVAVGEPVNGSLYLVNNGGRNQTLTIDGIYGSSSPLNSCSYFEFSPLYEPIVLPPGARVNLNETITWMQWHPKTYNSTWYAVLSVVGEVDRKADCLQLASNTVALDVISRPSPQGVSLVLSTDKQEYQTNETVHFTAYVDNNSDRPFELNNFEFGVFVTDKTGKEIVSLTWVSSDGNDVIKPYSTQAVPLDSAIWDQRYPDDGKWVQLTAGEYAVHAEYWSPFLKSKPITIKIITE